MESIDRPTVLGLFKGFKENMYIHAATLSKPSYSCEFPALIQVFFLVLSQEEMSGESVVSSAVPAATTRTTSFKGSSPSSKYVKLNVGGALYYTTMQTLTKQDTMLKAMFSGRMEVLTDSEGELLEMFLSWSVLH